MTITTTSQDRASVAAGARARPKLPGSRLTYRTEAWFAASFAAVAIAICAWCPPGHRWNPLMAVIAGGLFLLSVVVRVPMAGGSLAAGQPAFIVLLFVVPLNVMPLIVGALALAGSAIRSRELLSPRLLIWCNNSWWCVAPTLILAGFAPGPATWSHWPVYVAALIAQFGSDFAWSAVSTSYPSRMAPRERIADLLAAIRIDALMSPIGLAAAVLVVSAPGATVSLLVSVSGIVVLLARERSDSLHHQERALRDPLTGLANRALFEELMKATARRCVRANASAGLLLLDLNEFKAVNDTHGHQCGDQVLRGFAERILGRVRTTDTVARLGGDEFAVLVAEPTTIEATNLVASDLREALSSPLDIPGVGPVTLSASIGTSLLDGPTSPEDAVSAADQAMYAEKRTDVVRRGLPTHSPVELHSGGS